MKKLIHKDDRSPWGKVQYADYITPWLTRVHTASHGGYKVDRAHNSIIPEYLRRKGGWYEEDCEVVIIFAVLEDRIKKDMFEFSKQGYERALRERKYLDEFKRWYPVEHDLYFAA